MRRLFTLVMVALSLSITVARAQSTSAGEGLETYLKTQMEKRRIPGLQIAVVRQGRVTFSAAYGVANLETGTPVTRKTSFPVHSITKAFTGVAVMQLVEAGKLELDSPISRYHDALPAAWRAVTARQLLTHMSGIPDIWDANSQLIAPDEEAAWAKLQTLPMEFDPGARFKYNQTNYLLLGRIIEKLSGESFTDFIKARQLDPAGMAGTSFGDYHDVTPGLSGSYWYYRNVAGGMRPTTGLENYLRDWPRGIWPATGLNTTAEDIARWVIALQEGRLLDRKSAAAMWTPGVLNDGSAAGLNKRLNGYGLGWPMALRADHPAIGPTGGGRAALFLYPRDDLTVVILTNLIGASPDAFIDEVAGFFVADLQAVNGFGFSPEIKVLGAELTRRGFRHARQAAGDLQRADAKFRLAEGDVNGWGYALLEAGRNADALEIFKLNVALHPRSGNTHDSLAEAYAAAGDRAKAIHHYRRSLALDAKNGNAVEQLKKLEATPKP